MNRPLASSALALVAALHPFSAVAADVAAAPVDGCASHLVAAPPQDIKVGERAATLAGYKLTFKDPAATAGKLVLGVLGPINEDSGANIVALRQYVLFFKEQNVDAVVVSGDVGEVAAGIERATSEIAAVGVPVLAVSGNRECGGDFKKGIARAQKAHANIVNLNQVRAVEFKEATLVSVPGYHDPKFIACSTGCRYDKGTLEEMMKLAKESKVPVVLISHGPPKGSGNKALDYAINGGNVGDAELTKAVAAGGINFGIFSNIKEAGARATDLEGGTLIPQDKPSDVLFVNPGPADSTRWDMNDRTKGYGFAATMTIQGKQASWKLYRQPKLTKEQKVEAKALEPGKRRDEPEEAEGAKP